MLAQHLYQFASQIEEYEAEDLVEVLIDLAHWVDAWNRPASGLTSIEHAALDCVVEAVRTRDAYLSDRLDETPVLWTDRAELEPEDWDASLSLQDSRVGWKPVNALWTAPAMSGHRTAWSARVETYGDGTRRRNMIRLRRPDATRFLRVRGLQEARSLVSDRNSIVRNLGCARSEGIVAIDFTWRCVIEAEITGFRGESSPTDFPCGLGTECTLWLEMPIINDLDSPPVTVRDS
jgi:hypothetical protein